MLPGGGQHPQCWCLWWRRGKLCALGIWHMLPCNCLTPSPYTQCSVGRDYTPDSSSPNKITQQSLANQTVSWVWTRRVREPTTRHWMHDLLSVIFNFMSCYLSLISHLCPYCCRREGGGGLRNATAPQYHHTRPVTGRFWSDAGDWNGLEMKLSMDMTWGGD